MTKRTSHQTSYAQLHLPRKGSLRQKAKPRLFSSYSESLPSRPSQHRLLFQLHLFQGLLLALQLVMRKPLPRRGECILHTCFKEARRDLLLYSDARKRSGSYIAFLLYCMSLYCTAAHRESLCNSSSDPLQQPYALQKCARLLGPLPTFRLVRTCYGQARRRRHSDLHARVVRRPAIPSWTRRWHRSCFVMIETMTSKLFCHEGDLLSSKLFCHNADDDIGG